MGQTLSEILLRLPVRQNTPTMSKHDRPPPPARLAERLRVCSLG